MRHRRHSASIDDTELDMTPMLDVVFILLIFFIVTTSFVKEAGVTINQPSAETTTTSEKSNIHIAVTEDGSLWIDKRQVELGAVKATIKKFKSENPDMAVIIQADESSRTGLVVKVMDQVRLAGVYSVSIAAQQP